MMSKPFAVEYTVSGKRRYFETKDKAVLFALGSPSICVVKQLDPASGLYVLPGELFPVAYGQTHVGSAVVSAEHPTLADCAAKYEGAPLQEFEIPSAPDLPFGARLTILGVDHAATIGGDVSVGFSARLYKCKPVKGRRPRTYNALTLGIDCFKHLTFARLGPYADLDKVMAQDDYVCRIERELIQYAGRRKTPTLNRKVDRLRKILRTLKRGLYE